MKMILGKKKEKNNMKNHVSISFDANSINESFARMVVAAFMADMNPTLEQICDVKTAVSEAVTNAIIHGYGGLEKQENNCPQVEMICDRNGVDLTIQIMDKGAGIENIKQAMEPFYTTKREQERSGMGFAFMEAFMDELKVESTPEKGTKIIMTKKILGGNEQ